MCLVVDVHQLADRSVRVFLRGGKRLVAEQLLNGAEIGAISQQVRSKSVAQRMRMQVPVHVGKANVFFYDAPDRPLRQPATSIVQENRFTVRGTAAPSARTGLQQQL